MVSENNCSLPPPSLPCSFSWLKVCEHDAGDQNNEHRDCAKNTFDARTESETQFLFHTSAITIFVHSSETKSCWMGLLAELTRIFLRCWKKISTEAGTLALIGWILWQFQQNSQNTQTLSMHWKNTTQTMRICSSFQQKPHKQLSHMNTSKNGTNDWRNKCLSWFANHKLYQRTSVQPSSNCCVIRMAKHFSPNKKLWKPQCSKIETESRNEAWLTMCTVGTRVT